MARTAFRRALGALGFTLLTLGGAAVQAQPAREGVQACGGRDLLPELKARVSLLNEKNEVVARLGDDVARINGEGGGAIRNDASKWIPGKFVHPHDACFTEDGSIYVAEWVSTGRVSKLKRLT